MAWRTCGWLFQAYTGAGSSPGVANFDQQATGTARVEPGPPAMAAVERKSAGREVIMEPAAKPSVKAVDLMAALEKSLDAARLRPRPAKRPSPKRTVKHKAVAE